MGTLIEDKRVDMMVAAGKDPNTLNIMQRLVEVGVSVNCNARWGGETPLMYASGNGNLLGIRYLLDRGAIVDHPLPIWGSTALMYAIANDRLDAVRLLLREGANINYVTPIWGDTPLMAAKTRAMTEYLVERGADPRTVDTDGRNALMHAALHGQMSVVKFLLSIMPVIQDGLKFNSDHVLELNLDHPDNLECVIYVIENTNIGCDDNLSHVLDACGRHDLVVKLCGSGMQLRKRKLYRSA